MHWDGDMAGALFSRQPFGPVTGARDQDDPKTRQAQGCKTPTKHQARLRVRYAYNSNRLIRPGLR